RRFIKKETSHLITKTPGNYDQESNGCGYDCRLSID
ncbi:unnamed protein product, partial [Rotaria sp. Silwood1]